MMVTAPVFAQTIYAESDQDVHRTTAVSVQDDDDIRRSIVVNAKQGKPTHVIVDENDVIQEFYFTQKELADGKLIIQKLNNLDRETRIKVRNTLRSVNRGLAKMKGLDDESQIVVKIDGDDVNTDIDFDYAKLEKLKMLKHLGDMDKLHELAQLGELKELEVLEKLMSKEHATAIRHRVRQEHLTEEHERVMERQERAMERQHQAHEVEMQRAERSITVATERKRQLVHKHNRNMLIVDGEGSNIVYRNTDDDSSVVVRKFRLEDDNVVLKGHVDAILKLISHGEFSPDELNKLQQMLDSKR